LQRRADFAENSESFDEVALFKLQKFQ